MGLQMCGIGLVTPLSGHFTSPCERTCSTISPKQPFFETSASQYIKPSWHCLDLGSPAAVEVLRKYQGVMGTPEEFKRGGSYWHHSGKPGHVEELKDQRLPPLVPEEFAARAETKALTNGKDKGVLLKLQEDVSSTVLAHVETMSFSALGWDDSDMKLLGKALLLCAKLHMLDLSRNKVGAEGARALAEALPVCAPVAASRGP